MRDAAVRASVVTVALWAALRDERTPTSCTTSDTGQQRRRSLPGGCRLPRSLGKLPCGGVDQPGVRALAYKWAVTDFTEIDTVVQKVPHRRVRPARVSHRRARTLALQPSPEDRDRLPLCTAAKQLRDK